MGHSIFISYKYHDTDVYQYVKHELFEERKVGERTPRDYVNVLETYIKEYSPHYFKAEEDDTPLTGKTDDEIWDILKKKMFDSTMTIVLISPNMKTNEKETEQWIPREIKYSLDIEVRKNTSGNPEKSYTNAMMAIVLPDSKGEYTYYYEDKKCCEKGCRMCHSNRLFYILKKNIFNLKNNRKTRTCDNKLVAYSGDLHSFIPFYKWSDVDSKEKIEKAIKHSFDILANKDKYDICLEIEPRR